MNCRCWSTRFRACRSRCYFCRKFIDDDEIVHSIIILDKPSDADEEDEEDKEETQVKMLKSLREKLGIVSKTRVKHRESRELFEKKNTTVKYNAKTRKDKKCLLKMKESELACLICTFIW